MVLDLAAVSLRSGHAADAIDEAGWELERRGGCLLCINADDDAGPGSAAAATPSSSDRGSRRPSRDRASDGPVAPGRVTYRCPVSDAPTLPAPVRPTPDAGDRRGVVVAVAIGVAVLSFVGVFLLWRVFVDTLAGQQVENAAFQGALYGQTQLWRVAERVLDVVSVGFIVAVLIAAMVIAALRRRWSLAVQVAVLMIGANLTTQVLKKWVLYRPDLGVEADYGNTLPSGHTTAAASVSAALLLVVPPRARPWAAVLGAGYTTATGDLDAHRPVAPAVGRRRGRPRGARVDRDRVRAGRADPRAGVDGHRCAAARGATGRRRRPPCAGSSRGC